MSVGGSIIWLGFVAIALAHDRPGEFGRSVVWQMAWRYLAFAVLALNVMYGLGAFR